MVVYLFESGAMDSLHRKSTQISPVGRCFTRRSATPSINLESALSENSIRFALRSLADHLHLPHSLPSESFIFLSNV